mmetsp:Transcript_6538/g.8840  ORF Transcript_6538/g.8840 Transcript_6538/m.8840 type:complete len:295 (-) Transcript_6538:102-986(-)
MTTRRISKDLNFLISSEEWLLAQHRCESYPQEVKAWSLCPMLFAGELPSKALPIHLACSLRAPDFVLSTLIKIYSKGVGKKESAEGRLPLHLACQSGASVSTVGILLEKYPDGPRTKDTLSRLPLHLACADTPLMSTACSSSRSSCVGVVDALLAMYPEAAQMRDDCGQMPLHIACETGAPVGAIRLLIDAFPDAVTAETTSGSTPLIRAARLPNNPNNSEIISTLQFVISVRRLGRSPPQMFSSKATDWKERLSKKKSQKYLMRKSKETRLEHIVQKSQAKVLRHISDSSLLV